MVQGGAPALFFDTPRPNQSHATPAKMMRPRLADRTNTPSFTATQGRKRSRAQVEEQDDAIKPPAVPIRVLSQEKRDNTLSEPTATTSAAAFHPRRGGNQRVGRQSRLALSSVSATPLPTRPILESFVSSDVNDVYRFDPPTNANGDPFVGTYSHASRLGKDQILAIATLENEIQLINTSKPGSGSIPHGRPTTIPLHLSASIHDLLWRGDDKRIAAACDERMGMYDVETQSSIGLFTGHTASIKTFAWNPSNDSIIASAGRDGNICIWDLRKHSGAFDAKVDPVMFIKQAHNPAARRKRNVPNSTSKSVTSLLYLPNSPHHLVSSGSGDGILLKWDLRTARSANTPFQDTLEDPTITFTESQRSRGITSLALGPNGNTIFGLGADSIPYTYLTQNLQACPTSYPTSLRSTVGPRSISFASKLSVSPCGRWIATSGTEGTTNLYEIPRQSGVIDCKPVVLKSQAREVTGLSWAGSDTLGVCSNDFTARIWRSDAEIATRCRRESDVEWKWAE